MAEVYQLDLDEELLSHLADPDSVIVLRNEQASDELIEDETIRDIYTWQMAHYREHKKPASASVLANEFDLEFEEPLTSIGDLIERLRERYTRNRIRGLLEGLKKTYKEDIRSVPHYMLREGRNLIQITESRGNQIGTGDFDRALIEYDTNVLRGPGPSLGFKEIDEHFHGQRGLTTLLAPPGTYKTWIGINSLLENILNGLHCWYYSLEIPVEEANLRLLCLAAGVEWWKYIRGQITKEDRKKLNEAAEVLDGAGVYRFIEPIHGDRGITPSIERARNAGADIIYFDQLQYVEHDKKRSSLGGLNDTKYYWDVLDIARSASREGPLYFIHQFNRTVMFAEAMPEMQQAKGSSAVEETNTLVLGMWANKDMRNSNLLELGTLKTRNVPFASWEIRVKLSQGCSFDVVGKVGEE